MNASLHEIRDPERRAFEAALAERVAALFRSCPVLCGFTLHAVSPVPSNLICFPALHDEDMEEILGEVSAMLLELIEEQPEAAELLPGRTFARSLH